MTEYYHKWFSQYTNREFEMLVFGTSGIPVILFPPAGQKYFEAKDKGLISSLSPLVEQEKIKIYSIDSFDNYSWYNFLIDPSERVDNYLNFESLIIHDIIGFTRYETEYNKTILAGIGFGGYHALNFGLKHPDMVSGIVSIGGIFDIKQFIYGFYNDNCYFNNPPDYLPGLNDNWYIDKLKKTKIRFVAEEERNNLTDSLQISSLLNSKGIINHLETVPPADLWETAKETLSSILEDVVSSYQE
jgi:esterase/lipase superfamily enzyme